MKTLITLLTIVLIFFVLNMGSAFADAPIILPDGVDKVDNSVMVAVAVNPFTPLISLTWNAGDETATNPMGSATGFKVYRATKSCVQVSVKNDYVLIDSNVTVLKYDDTNIPIGTRNICYVVTAFNDGGESGLSNQAGKLLNVAPSAPSAPKFN